MRPRGRMRVRPRWRVRLRWCARLRPRWCARLRPRWRMCTWLRGPRMPGMPWWMWMRWMRMRMGRMRRLGNLGGLLFVMGRLPTLVLTPGSPRRLTMPAKADGPAAIAKDRALCSTPLIRGHACR